MQATLFYETHFDAAHFLPDHPKCGQVHGHTYKVRAELTGKVNSTTGMVMDLADLKWVLEHRIEVFYDHQLLNGNDLDFIPTVENIAHDLAKYIFDELLCAFSVSVTVWEGVNQGAIVQRRLGGQQ